MTKDNTKDNIMKQNEELAELNLLQRQRTETDATYAYKSNLSFSYCNIICTFFTMLFRPFILLYNLNLAREYYKTDQYNYAVWTLCCIIIPIVLTTIIHGFMCYYDKRFSQGFHKGFKTIFRIIISVFLRDWNTFVYYCLCKKAEITGNKELQRRYFDKATREESDIAFIGLFDCFLESAPQKILTLSIILTESYNVKMIQGIALVLYFGNMAWCLKTYHCSVRIPQEDKENINRKGQAVQVLWHFCISVSRTLCIAFVASLFPFWTLIACVVRIFVTGFVLFIADRPYCPQLSILNFFFCLCFGCIYLFTYIATREARTRNKYFIFFTVFLLENALCVYLFFEYARIELKSSVFLFHSLCSSAILFYFFGIFLMILYYKCFHPTVVARKKSKFITK